MTFSPFLLYYRQNDWLRLLLMGLVYAYGWSTKGERCYARPPGNRGIRISVIAGLHQHKLAAPCHFTGFTDTSFFNEWLENHLLPELPSGVTIIMDNARFHKSSRTREIIEKAGCFLLFLPPYSPDLNPIEQRLVPTQKHRKKNTPYLPLPSFS